MAIIPIKDMIYGFTLDSLKRRVDRALNAGATVIVLELDTPGGVVISALDIAKYIKADIPVPTVAWVHDQAYSAGILIASACNQIVMSSASTTGDCAPIVPGQELAPTERAKALSPLLEEFRDNASKNGYDYAMFHAMCVLGVEVYLIENKQDGRRMLVNQADYAIMVDGKPADKSNVGTAAPVPSSATIPANVPAFDGVSAQVATEADRYKWKKIKQFHDGKTLLTVNQTRAMEIGLAKSDKIDNESDIRQFLSASSVTVFDQTWSENAAGWLTHPIVRSVLVLVLLLGAYIEFQTPGLGVAGGVAALALVILLGAPYVIGLAEVWHILVFFAGVCLLIIEFAVIPGFGVFGVAGLICMFGGLVMMAVPSVGTGPVRMPPPEMVARMQQSIIWMMMSMCAAGVGLIYLFRNFDRLPMVGRMVLQDEQSAPHDAQTVSGNEAVGGGQIRMGATGIASTELRPSGRAQIDGQIIDVVTVGAFIEPGQPVQVVEVHGNRIVVDLAE